MTSPSSRQADAESMLQDETQYHVKPGRPAVAQLCREWLVLVQYVEAVECACEKKIRCGAAPKPIVYQCNRCATLAKLTSGKEWL